MTTKLNLGCGRVTFPLDKANPPGYLHHLEPLEDTVFEPGWVNVDKFPMPGIDERVDLFRFPWVRSSNGSPWNDDTFDEIYAAHILEHVPHQVKVYEVLPAPIAAEYFKTVNALDGFFVFMAECWRLLKPGGLMNIRCPYPYSWAALSDPTHTRQVTPGSFSYLTGQDDADEAPFDYHLPCRFEVIVPVIYRFNEKWGSKLDDFTPKGLEDVMMTYLNVCNEYRIKLRAIK